MWAPTEQYFLADAWQSAVYLNHSFTHYDNDSSWKKIVINP